MVKIIITDGRGRKWRDIGVNARADSARWRGGPSRSWVCHLRNSTGFTVAKSSLSIGHVSGSQVASSDRIRVEGFAEDLIGAVTVVDVKVARFLCGMQLFCSQRGVD